ncbi:Gp138 family membrane-puncturing spike protein [Pseudomonas otitidis]|uniref:Gp138 family membrane-puncturing spike protein n=1 Tax=Metapseudomonas otitidis TaxID=319939 RepID=A0ABU3XRA3_9GAMM|nr:Gp138 family membrane-puncturing spike protein [Pseudomonas otitidis]MDV3440448.1 Gp138 family membrane-puncturing spike protein [Pseudomonas otitidis]WMR35298.1 Gp138 family membrane-puncturing spike protein [Pseudomonas otitidis]
MGNYDWQTPSTEVAMGTALDTRIKRLHTALPGRIVTFDAARQVASVQPMIEQQLMDGSRQPLPMLPDVPVQFPRGGGFVLTFPVKPDDECLLVFNERCIDGWWHSGASSEPLDYRQHDLSDAVAVMGISSLPQVVPAFATDAVELRRLDGSAYVRLDEGGTLTLDGAKVLIKCPVVFEAGLTGKGDVVSSGISLEQHLHGQVMPGPAVTGVPQ